MDKTAEKVDTPTIYLDLKNRLIEAEFEPGKKLKPDDLRELYGCSVNTIREVLLRLSSVGLALFEDQRGFRAPLSSAERCNDLTRFRILLEQEGTTLSMEYGGLEWEAKLTATHHKLGHIKSHLGASKDETTVIALWTNAELEFHETLISACRSPLLIETFGKVYDQFRQQIIGQRLDVKPDHFDRIIKEHEKIVDAALNRDSAACRAAIFDHLKRNIS